MYPNPVLEAFQKAYEIGLQEKQLNQQKEEHEQELEFRKQQQADAKEQQNIANKAAQAWQDMQQAQMDHAQAQQNYTNAISSQRTGITPPGMVSVPGLQQPNYTTQTNPGGTITTNPTGPLVLSGLENTQYISPKGQTFTVPPLAESPEQALVRQQQRDLENREAAKQQAIQAREQAIYTLRDADQARRELINKGIDHNNRIAEIQATKEGNLEVEKQRGANELAVAKAKLGMDLQDFANQPGSVDMLNKANMGLLSMEDINKSPYKKQFSQLALDRGIQFLPKAQTDKLGAIGTMTQLLPKIQRQIQLQYSHPYEITIPGTPAYTEFKGLSQEIKAGVPFASQALSNVRRFTQPELDNFNEYFIPNKLPTDASLKANMDKYNSFVNDLRRSTAQTVKGSSQGQIDAIVGNLKSQGATYLNGFGTNEINPTSPTPPGGGNIYDVDSKGNFILRQPPTPPVQRPGFIFGAQ